MPFPVASLMSLRGADDPILLLAVDMTSEGAPPVELVVKVKPPLPWCLARRFTGSGAMWSLSMYIGSPSVATICDIVNRQCEGVQRQRKDQDLARRQQLSSMNAQ
jgi:hypothetical protein